MSIKRKLTLMMMGISLAAVFLTVAAITTYLIYDMRKEKIQELKVTAAVTGDRNSAALLFLDSERVQRNLEIFHLNPSILAACLYDIHGSLFAFYKADTITSNGCPEKTSYITSDHLGLLSALADVEQKGDKVGTILLLADTRGIDAYVHKIILISAIVIVVVMIFLLLLTFYFQRTISTPILELAATAQSITQSITGGKAYTQQAKAAYADETGILARAFNAMLAEVRKRDADLREANETLEQKVVERTHQLEKAKRKAEAASDAKSEFLRNMSHEFRTPLHAIISFSSYGIKEFASAERDTLKRYFELILKGSERLSRLVGEVLDLAKLEQREQMFMLACGDLREMVTRAAEMVQPLLAQKNLVFDYKPNSNPMLALYDSDKMMQVVTNLLGNAIKFTSAYKRISVVVESRKFEGSEHIAVSVMDEGIGIPDDEKEMIFESFRQSSRTNTGAGGTGLGLSICREIVKAHGGRIWAENNAGGGAIVTFCIPAIVESPQNTQTSHSPKEAHHENAA